MPDFQIVIVDASRVGGSARSPDPRASEGPIVRSLAWTARAEEAQEARLEGEREWERRFGQPPPASAIIEVSELPRQRRPE